MSSGSRLHPAYRLVAGYLAGFVALAGLVGLSPWLHVAFEHNSPAEGPSHFAASLRHHGTQSQNLSPRTHSHSESADGQRAHHHHPDAPTDHEHHTLPTLLAAGLVEGAVAELPLPSPPRLSRLSVPLLDGVSCFRPFDLHQAARPPPQA